MNPAHRRGLLLGAGAFTAWGLLSPVNEILLRHWTPMWMQAVRGTAAMLVLLLLLRGPGLDGAVAVLRRPAIVAALVWGTLISFALFVLSQTRIEATFATLGFYTSPVWAAVLARVMLGERMGKWFGPAIAAMLVGGYLALTGGGALPNPDWWGITMALGAGATWAVYAVLLRRHSPDVGPWELLLASTLVGNAGFLVAASVTEPIPDFGAIPLSSWGWMAVQVAIPTLLALGMFQLALRHAPAGQVTILVGFELVATVFFAWLLLGDTFTTLQMAGLALTLVAVSAYLWLHRPHPASD